MMPLVTGVLQCYTALMEVGKVDLGVDDYFVKFHVQWIFEMY